MDWRTLPSAPTDRPSAAAPLRDPQDPSPGDREDTPARAGETLRIDEEPEPSGRRSVRSLFLRDDG